MTVVDESQSPSASSSKPKARLPLFGFGEPKEPIQDDLLSNPVPSPSGPAAEELLAAESLAEHLSGPEPGSADGWDDESEPSESRASTSSQGSTRVGNPLNEHGLRDMARAGVLIAGDQAHNLLANTPGKQAVGLYRTDEDDAAAIGDPLARIAGRHQGVGEVNSDTADLLASMLGLARWGSRQVVKNQQAKELDASNGAPIDPRQAVDL